MTRPTLTCGVVGLLAVALTSGCAMTGMMGGARTLAPGQIELGLRGGAAADPFEVGAGPVVPTVEVAGRMGLTERIDLGLRAGAGASAEARFQIVRSEMEGHFAAPFSLDALIAPTLGAKYGSICSGDACVLGPSFSAQVPVVIGLNLPRGHQILFCQRLSLVFAKQLSLAVGGNVGLVLNVTDHWSVVPELGVLLPVYPVAAVVFRVQGGVALLAHY